MLACFLYPKFQFYEHFSSTEIFFLESINAWIGLSKFKILISLFKFSSGSKKGENASVAKVHCCELATLKYLLDFLVGTKN